MGRPERASFEELIAALQIFAKYATQKYPTHCEHDVLYICGGVKPENVTVEDGAELERMGFIVDGEMECFASFRFGSS